MDIPSFRERLAAGKALRDKVPRSAHARWRPRTRGRDVIAMLKDSDRGRIGQLVPIRYGRMLESPFAFLRGAASVMAFDLAPTPATGIRVQACGDAHLLNFGGFASPERHLVFDLNDFDETLPAPWEWDVKRLAASIAVAARSRGLSRSRSGELTRSVVKSYRDAMAHYAPLGVVPRWYQRIDAHEVPGLRLEGAAREAKPQLEIERLLPRLTTVAGSLRRFREDPPAMYHPGRGERSLDHVRYFLRHYRRSLVEDRRLLLERYQLVDVVVKVPGIGSVGRRVLVALLMAADDDALFLQFKEARASVLEPYAGASRHPNHGQRVVEGQRLMQAATDIFIGWSRIPALGAHFYVRQLRDHKIGARLEDLGGKELEGYVSYCGRALARGHAKAGAAEAIAGYLGRRGAFDNAVAAFAERYADRTEADHEALQRAVRAGRIAAERA